MSTMPGLVWMVLDHRFSAPSPVRNPDSPITATPATTLAPAKRKARRLKGLERVGSDDCFKRGSNMAGTPVPSRMRRRRIGSSIIKRVAEAEAICGVRVGGAGLHAGGDPVGCLRARGG